MGNEARDYGAHADDAPLLPGPGGYVWHRTAKNTFWKWFYLLALAATIGGGVFAVVHRNPDFSKLYTSDYMRDPAHCPADAGPTRRLLSQDDEKIDATLFLQASGVVVAISLVGGLLLGLGSLLLFKHKPHAMVGVTVGVQVLIPLGVAIAALVGGAAPVGWSFLFMAGLLAFTFWLYREQLALVGRLLSVSTRALSEQPGIIFASLGLQLIGALVTLPLLAAMFAGYTNGYVGPNPAVASMQPDKTCVDEEGKAVLCCAWQLESWVPWYLAAAALMLSWTSLLVFTIRLYTISGATAQWYFAPVGQPNARKGLVLRSLGHAMGPSFGSLCLGSWVLTAIQYARAALQSMKDQARQNGDVCAGILASCIDMLYALLQQLSKFGIVVMAITGEGFFESCQHAVALLTRNLLDTVGVWWFPGMVLQSAAFIMSAAWGVLAFFGAYSWWGRDTLAAQNGAIVGVVAFVVGLLVLVFINGILLNVVDAVYICYAMDRDTGACTMIAVHEVYSQLPSVKGGVVEDPDGHVRYGRQQEVATGPSAPQLYPHQQQQQQGAYAPPAMYPQIGRV